MRDHTPSYYEQSTSPKYFSLFYLIGGDDLAVPLARVEKTGGKVEMPKMAMGENGFMTVFKDTKDNRVAFHSMR